VVEACEDLESCFRFLFIITDVSAGNFTFILRPKSHNFMDLGNEIFSQVTKRALYKKIVGSSETSVTSI